MAEPLTLFKGDVGISVNLGPLKQQKQIAHYVDGMGFKRSIENSDNQVQPHIDPKHRLNY